MHLKEAPYIGALFIALTAVCIALALTLPFHDSPTVWALTAAVTAAAVLAYALSRTVALPQIGDDVGNWTEPLGLLSITTEFLSAARSVIALKSNHEVHGRSNMPPTWTSRSVRPSGQQPADRRRRSFRNL
ncbi:hypothetical protein [Streptomyces sp. NPDC048445]|uniref:hypothetical protein n=1 Tax=unclassified Streptomyces TaxID=2593676 RepID=UPI00371E974D